MPKKNFYPNLMKISLLKRNTENEKAIKRNKQKRWQSINKNAVLCQCRLINAVGQIKMAKPFNRTIF